MSKQAKRPRRNPPLDIEDFKNLAADFSKTIAANICENTVNFLIKLKIVKKLKRDPIKVKEQIQRLKKAFGNVMICPECASLGGTLIIHPNGDQTQKCGCGYIKFFKNETPKPTGEP